MTRRGFLNANIEGRSETAFLTDEGKFVKFGTNEEIQKLLFSSDETIDLRNAYVLPGFVDSHCHLMETGHFLKNVDLKDCKSLKQVIRKLAKAEETNKEFVIARGYDDSDFIRPLDRTALDEISTTTPICATRVCGHKMVVNSKVIDMLHLDENELMPGGIIDLEKGILEEEAVVLVHDLWKKPTIEDMQEDIILAGKKANEKGITTVFSDDFMSITTSWKDVLDAYLQLSFQKKLPVRIVQQCEFEDAYNFAEFLDEGYTMGMGDEYFSIGPLKLILDGSFGARSAALMEDYSDDLENKGLLNLTDDEICGYIELANKYNMPTIMHAIGDRAILQALRCMQKSNMIDNPLHSGIVHCGLMNEQMVETMKELQLVSYIQSLFINSDASFLEKRLDEKRVKDAYPFKSLYEAGLLNNGSDAPVETMDPLLGIELAVTRTSLDGHTLNKDQALTLDEAIASYTTNPLKTMYMEHGLEEGYNADFVVLEKDLHDVETNKIHEVQVLLTVMDGELVYEK